VTVTEGPVYESIAELTHPFLKRYAEKCGADFIVLNGSEISTFPVVTPHYLKFKLYDLLKDYDRIIYLDTDIVVSPTAANLFEIVNEKRIGLLDEAKYQERSGLVARMAEVKSLDIQGLDLRSYFNTGVMVLSKQHRPLFAPFFRAPLPTDGFFEQTYLNYRIAKQHSQAPRTFGLHYLSNWHNWMSFFWGPNLEMRLLGHFIHYAGNAEQMPLSEFLQLLRSDLQKLYPNDKEIPKEKIAISVSGGLGDHISAQPAVRYAVEHLYKDQDVIIVSHHPEVWEGLNIPHFKEGESFIKDAPDRQVLSSLPPINHFSWQTLSHALCNATDYASILLTKGTLPDEPGLKRIRFHEKYYDVTHPQFPKTLFEKIGFDKTDPRWNRLILVHPGRGWESKTFPADVWESYCREFQGVSPEYGYLVVVIGKNSGDQGVVEFDRSPYIDLVDKLTLEELIALIGHTQILLTNDSAPVHIAGGFETHIGLIATCKRPEYVLPYRGSSHQRLPDSIWWRARALEQEPTIYGRLSRKPTTVGEIRMDSASEEALRATLPTPLQIVGWALGMHDPSEIR